MIFLQNDGLFSESMEPAEKVELENLGKEAFSGGKDFMAVL